jgi:hypothetical protein
VDHLAELGVAICHLARLQGHIEDDVTIHHQNNARGMKRLADLQRNEQETTLALYLQ